MTKSIKIAAVGDLMLGDSHYYVGNGVRSKLVSGKINNPFEYVRDVLKKADIVIGNLETILSDLGRCKYRLSSIQYRGNKEFIRYLKDANFKVLSVANNHIYEHGKDAMLDTIRNLERNGILAVGLPEIRQSSTPEKQILALEGKKIAFLSYCLNYENNTKKIVSNELNIISDLSFFKKKADLIFILLHWGYEFMSYPSPEQIRIAHKLIDSGADIIIGHHPHVLQGIENYRKKIIAYSLGNFVFDMDLDIKCRKSMILLININDNRTICSDFVPILINQDYQPVPLQDRDDKLLREELIHLNDDIKISMEFSDRFYLLSAKKNLDKFRKKIHLIMLKRFFRQPPYISIQLLFKAIKNQVLNFLHNRIKIII